MKLGSLFDGIGGFPLAATKHGITPVWASEIEPFPINVTKRHFPNMKHLGDITQINGAEIEPVDIITFGSPCQDLSIAGKREGLGGERSGLFKSAIRIIRDMRNATGGKYPRFAVWENVPGAFSSNKGADFKAVLEEITEAEFSIPQSGKWASAGMVRSNSVDIAWRVLDAQYWGVPQRRKRIFLVADFTGQCAAEILFKPESLPGYFEKGKSQGEGTAGSAQDCIRAADGCLTPWDVQSRRIHSVDGKWPALYGGEGGGHGYAFIPSIGFIGNQDGGDNIAEKCPTLRADPGSGNGCKMAVCIPINDKATRFKGGGNTRNNDGAGNGLGVGKPGDPMPTLTAGDRHAVAFSFDSLSSNSMKSNNPNSGCRQVEVAKTLDTTRPDPAKNQGGIAVIQSYAVRRLTPVECLRLQGLPDWWFDDIPGNSDTACYKAAGNGMAHPCPDYVLAGIAEILKRDRWKR